MATRNSVYYTYLIGWSHLNIWYYGSRYCQGAHPSDLWVKYWTSSKHVTNLRKTHGEPDIIQVRRTFTCPKKCHRWETRVLRRLDARRHPLMLNGSNNEGYSVYKNVGKVLTVDNLGNEHWLFKDDQMILTGLVRELTREEISDRSERIRARWYVENRERIRERQKEYQQNNREKIAMRNEKNKEQRREYLRNYREDNKAELTRKAKEYRHKTKKPKQPVSEHELLARAEKKVKGARERNKNYYSSNRETLIEKAKEYREANEERVKQSRREYYQKNKEEIKQKQKEKYAKTKSTV
jgi:hypothetical protein